jgi:hypothetical protein
MFKSTLAFMTSLKLFDFAKDSSFFELRKPLNQPKTNQLSLSRSTFSEFFGFLTMPPPTPLSGVRWEFDEFYSTVSRSEITSALVRKGFSQGPRRNGINPKFCLTLVT